MGWGTAIVIIIFIMMRIPGSVRRETEQHNKELDEKYFREKLLRTIRDK